MAGVEFDRQAFIPSTAAPQGRPLMQLLAPLLFVAAVVLIAFLGYKIFLVNTQNNDLAAANAHVQQLEQQLTEMQKRLDTMEKHRKPAAAEPSATSTDATKTTAPAPAQRPRTVYRIASASALPAAPVKQAPPAPAPAPVAPAVPPELANAVAANHEAWEATTNRLADVVGVVGTQQSEITATRDAVNQLLSQTHRQAVSFELDRGNSRTPVGPVTLQLKSADSRSQHYSVCVFFSNQKCIELKDRALNEVVVFVVAKNSAPLELVATKIQRDQIVGYLEVPSGLQ
jgi:hypothetical protein